MWSGPRAPSGNANWRGGSELDNGRPHTGGGSLSQSQSQNRNNGTNQQQNSSSNTRYAQPTAAEWWGSMGPADEREEQELFTQKISTGTYMS